MTFELHSPWWLLSLLAVVAAMVLAVRYRPPTIGFSDIRPVVAGTRHAGGWHHLIQKLPVVLMGLALVFLVVALARPRFGIERRVHRGRGIDIMLILDVSGSMQQVYDNVPREFLGRALSGDSVRQQLDTRLETAITELKRFVQNRPEDRIGLVAFSRIPFVVSPPTFDHDFLLSHLDLLASVRDLPDGTGIAAPLGSAVARLKDSEAERRVAVLFSDGADNASRVITPRQAAEVAAQYNVSIYTVGIGAAESYYLRPSFTGTYFQPAQQSYDRKMLEDIAQKTGGRFFSAGSSEEFRQVMEEIDALETVEMDAPVYTEYRERFLPLVLAGLAFVLVAVVLENGLLQSIP